MLLRKSVCAQNSRRLASARTIAAAGIATTESEWTYHHGSVAFAAAAVGAFILGSSFASGSEEKKEALSSCNKSSMVQCEAVLQDGNIRTISRENITQHQIQDVKSLRAYRSAVENDLFCDELKSENDVTSVAPPTDTSSNAITERFASLPFSSVPHANVRPRMSVRHTHRTHSTDDDLGGGNEEETDEQLLATSTDVEAPAAAKSYNTTLGTIANAPDTTEDMVIDPKNKEVILRKIKTMRKNCQDQVYTKNMYFYKSAAIMKDNVRAKVSVVSDSNYKLIIRAPYN